MEEDDYYDKDYAAHSGNGNNQLRVSKNHKSDCSTIEMRINGTTDSKITLKDKDRAEALYWMLANMLGL